MTLSELTIEDIDVMIQIINAGVERKMFTTEEIPSVNHLLFKLIKIIKIMKNMKNESEKEIIRLPSEPLQIVFE